MTSTEPLRKLHKLGFTVDRVTGSHGIMYGPQGQRAVVPFHGSHDLRRGTLQSICKPAGVSEEQFRRL